MGIWRTVSNFCRNKVGFLEIKSAAADRRPAKQQNQLIQLRPPPAGTPLRAHHRAPVCGTRVVDTRIRESRRVGSKRRCAGPAICRTGSGRLNRCPGNQRSVHSGLGIPRTHFQFWSLKCSRSLRTAALRTAALRTVGHTRAIRRNPPLGHSASQSAIAVGCEVVDSGVHSGAQKGVQI